MAATDQEMFDQATGKTPAEPIENTPETPTEAPVEAKEDNRDEKGRFRAKAALEPIPEVVPEPEPEPAVEDKSDRIPSWRLKEEAEARREWQGRAEAAERQRQEYEQQMRTMQQRLQEFTAPKQDPIDPFADPQGYYGAIQEQINRISYESRIDNQLRWAGMKHGEDVLRDAVTEMDRRAKMGDHSVRMYALNSSDPGETLVTWWKREQAMQSIGEGGVEAYRQRILDEALKDPDYQAKAIEAFKATQAKPTNPINIPPSLSRASAARSSHDESVGGSGADMYAFATSKRK